MQQIILAPDSFKGTLEAVEVCRILAQAARKTWPECRVHSLPVADGGEGTVDCFLRALDAGRITLPVTGPFYGETVSASYALSGDTAILETASTAGLPRVEGRENPAATTTYGLGELIRDALGRGCTRIVLGLGGSCTNDCGVGLARALGTVFYDRSGNPFVPRGDTLEEISRYDCSETRRLLAGVELTAMCDIDNPLYGPRGAARVFAPQKGAGPELVTLLDRNLQAMAESIRQVSGLEVQKIPGAGAAGGLGAGVAAFLGGSLRPGIDLVLELTGFDRLLPGTDLVITGEGRVDSQSLDGKVVSGVAKRARAAGVPVLVLAGSVGDDLDLGRARAMGVTAVCSINRVAVDFSVSRHQAGENLAFAAENLMNLLRSLGR